MHNRTYPKGGVWFSKDSFVVNQTFVFQINFCGKSPALRVAAKRYTGTAGVRNNSNDINNGNLNTRIFWHLSGNKTMTSLCSGTMSTFRRTIGSLLADDNKIESDLIFYSLSPTSCEKALKPKSDWYNLWVGGGRGRNSAKYLKEFLSRMN